MDLMEKLNKYVCMSLLLAGSFDIHGKEANLAVADYSKMSRTELETAFISAVEDHDLEEMQALIQAGANVHTPIPYTYTAGDCDWRSECTALMYAIRHNWSDMVEELLKLEENLDEALNVAITESYLSIVEQLIKGGADIHHVNKDQDTPLIVAIRKGRLGVVNELIKRGADIHYVNRNQDTPLIIAAREGHSGVLKELIKRGANVSHVNAEGRTALMYAVINHDFNTVQILLEVPEIHEGSFFGFGTEPINYADKDGNTALILAIQNVHWTYFDTRGYNLCLNSQNIVNALLESPEIDLYHVNQNGESAVELLEKIHDKMNRYLY